jgi:hypothetical protein
MVSTWLPERLHPVVPDGELVVFAMQGVTAQIKALATGGIAERQAHPYDIGIGSNLQAVFGDSLWHWCVPPVSTAADGTSYPTRYDHKHDFW